VVSGRENLFFSLEVGTQPGPPPSPRREEVRVRVGGLSSMVAGTNYRLVGQSSRHPANHYATPRVRQALQSIADQFASEFSGQPGYQVLEYNDISLVWGGLFDIYRETNWQPPHIYHRVGINVDFSNADELPGHMQAALRRIIRDHGGVILNEGNHWHVTFN
jgi:hypothetical protein